MSQICTLNLYPTNNYSLLKKIQAVYHMVTRWGGVSGFPFLVLKRRQQFLKDNIKQHFHEKPYADSKLVDNIEKC